MLIKNRITTFLIILTLVVTFTLTLQVLSTNIYRLSRSEKECKNMNEQGLKIGCPAPRLYTGFISPATPDYRPKNLLINLGFYIIIFTPAVVLGNNLWHNKHKH